MKTDDQSFRQTMVDELEEEIYHAYSQGSNTPNLMRSDADFVFAMNRIAILTLMHNVRILAFAIMTTHFHFIIRGSCSACMEYLRSLAKSLVMRLSDNENQLSVSRINFQLSRVRDTQSLKEKISYVLRNPLEVDPYHLLTDYRWSSNGLYLTETARCRTMGNPVSSLSLNMRRKMFGTRTSLPPDWRIDNEGMLLPANYVDYEYVNAIFKTARTYYHFMGMSKNRENEIRLEEVSDRMVSCSDSELRARAEKSAGRSLKHLNIDERVQLAMSLRKEVFSSRGQLSRVLRLPYDLLIDIQV